jgi:hypothetical protein
VEENLAGSIICPYITELNEYTIVRYIRSLKFPVGYTFKALLSKELIRRHFIFSFLAKICLLFSFWEILFTDAENPSPGLANPIAVG